MQYEHFLYLKNFSEMNLKVGGVGQKTPKWPFWLFSIIFKILIGECAAKVPDLQPMIYIRMTEQSCFQAISSLTKLDRRIVSWVNFWRKWLFWGVVGLPGPPRVFKLVQDGSRPLVQCPTLCYSPPRSHCGLKNPKIGENVAQNAPKIVILGVSGSQPLPHVHSN